MRGRTIKAVLERLSQMEKLVLIESLKQASPRTIAQKRPAMKEGRLSVTQGVYSSRQKLAYKCRRNTSEFETEWVNP
jgi:hypothetical protein